MYRVQIDDLDNSVLLGNIQIKINEKFVKDGELAQDVYEFLPFHPFFEDSTNTKLNGFITIAEGKEQDHRFLSVISDPSNDDVE
jgi:uncharacterized pyridoxal phosphate-containing UPF0001 family protein